MTAAREWFSAAELSGFPGVPATESGTIRRARAEHWKARDREGRGGGREYHLTALPEKTRVALLLREQRSAPKAAPEPPRDDRYRAQLLAAFERRPESVRDEAKRRLKLLLALDAIVASNVPLMEAYRLLAEQSGESESTIRNWKRRVKGFEDDRGLWWPLLAPKHIGRTTTAQFDERIYQLFRDGWLDRAQPPSIVIYRYVTRWADAEGVPMPSEDTLMRLLLKRVPLHVRVLEREGPAALRAVVPHAQRDVSMLHAMEELNADGHILDVLVEWPDGERGRPMMITTQDVHSRDVVGFHLAKAESAFEMMRAFHKVFVQFGIPKALGLDNTLAAASKKMTAGASGRKRYRDRPDDPEGVLTTLGIDVHFTQIAHGQSKPIERAFGTLQPLIARHPDLAGAYVGPNTRKKPEGAGSKYVPIAQLEAIVAAGVLEYNLQEKRHTQMCAGIRSFHQVFDASFRANADKIARLTESQARLLLYPGERLKVRRGGTVWLFKNQYFAPELCAYAGHDVVVRYDTTTNLHEHPAYFFTLKGQPIVAVRPMGMTGYRNAGDAETVARAQSQLQRSAKDVAKKQRHYSASVVRAMIPPQTEPPHAADDTSLRRLDFTQATTPEQLGAARVERRDAERRVVSAIDKVASLVIEPRRQRA